MELILRPFSVEDEMIARRAHEELAADDVEFLPFFDPAHSWRDYLQVIDDHAAGRNLPADRVAGALLAAEVDGLLVGRTSLRFTLNDFLLARGGHVGYAVRPAFRRRGYASEILRQSLIVLNARGVNPVLVTCDDTNLASATVIERHGARLASLFIDDDGTRIRRYWISHDAATSS